MTLTLTSPDFAPGAAMPTRCTGEGRDASPALAWNGAPAGTGSFALIVDDPDAPDPAAPRRTWVHWVACDIPPETGSLDEGASGRAMPPGAVEGRNDSGGIGYEGPYPPIGRHRYYFKLYALDCRLGLRPGMSKAGLLAAMQGHVLASAELVGTYEKSGSR